MKTLPVAVVGVLVVVAGLGAQGRSGSRKPAPVQTEFGTADLAAVKPEDGLFEQVGEISDNGLIVMLDWIRKFERVKYVGIGAKEQANLRRQAQLAGGIAIVGAVLIFLGFLIR